MYSEDYLYTEEHEWIHIQGDQCTIGITDFAQQELGEVVYVDLPDVGLAFQKGDEIGSLESVKAVAEFYAPVAGEVLEVNSSLEDAPEIVNDDPHRAGWLVKIRLSPDADMSGLMKATDYAQLIAG